MKTQPPSGAQAATCVCAALLLIPATAQANGHLIPVYGATGPAVSQIAVAECAGGLVTAVRNSSGKLLVSQWQDTGTNPFLLATGSAGVVSQVAVAAPYSNIIVTAVINGTNEIELITWKTGSTTLKRLASVNSTAASSISMSVFEDASGPKVATAARDSNGNLSISVWYISPSGQITWDAGYTGPPVIEAAIAPTYFTDQLVTAVRTSSGDLQVTSWTYDLTANLIIQQGSASAGGVKQLSLGFWTSDAATYTDMATAVVNGSSKLEIISWRVTESGAVSREGSANAEAASQVAVGTTWNLEAMTAIVNSSGSLGAATWIDAPVTLDVNDDTTSAITNVAIAQSASPNHMVTASRTASGTLALEVWEVF